MTSRKLLGFIMLLCCSFLLFAFYLQHYQYVLPCPLCVVQRYAYAAIVLFCVLGRLTPFVRFASFLSLLASIGGAVAASSQLWAMKNPSVQCGRDPLEAFMNSLLPAKWLPSVFKADGYCGEVLDRILGLTPPEWSLAWFMLFAFIFFIIMLRRGS
ncbi:disulfide bond formation protein B [Oxalobacter sp. OttesenSCG-928-P03]|nr:disulfide bond formation protein B [Oxalobacter sp. OttesenSCG-928-P03]